MTLPWLRVPLLVAGVLSLALISCVDVGDVPFAPDAADQPPVGGDVPYACATSLYVQNTAAPNTTVTGFAFTSAAGADLWSTALAISPSPSYVKIKSFFYYSYRQPDGAYHGWLTTSSSGKALEVYLTNPGMGRVLVWRGRAAPGINKLSWQAGPAADGCARIDVEVHDDLVVHDDYVILHEFGDGTVFGDGRQPASGLIRGADGNFYGESEGGGAAGHGTLFKMTPGGGITILHDFGVASGDGAMPRGGLTQGPDGSFYGTTVGGGSAGLGTIFKLTPGVEYRILHHFLGPDGEWPWGGLAFGLDGWLYGTTTGNSSVQHGVAYRISTQGTGYFVLHYFGSVVGDASVPTRTLLRNPSGDFYGVSFSGPWDGEIFKMTPTGAVTVLHRFTSPGPAEPSGVTLAADGKLYGVTVYGGSRDGGVFYSLTGAGVFTVLHDFSVDGLGFQPSAWLVLANGNFYGAADRKKLATGSPGDYGLIYKMTPAGVETVMHEFGPPPDGALAGPMVQGADGYLYGTTFFGGVTGGGITFRLRP